MVNNDLINSKQGEWLVDDVEKANQILQSVGGAPAGGGGNSMGARGRKSSYSASLIPWLRRI
jgi:hypothetical protein